jgi:hypothetical protein
MTALRVICRVIGREQKAPVVMYINNVIVLAGDLTISRHGVVTLNLQDALVTDPPVSKEADGNEKKSRA